MVTTPVFEHLFNIGQGLKSFDTSGNHRHSVLSGNPSWVAGRKGKAIALDGTDDAFVAPVPECDNDDFTVGFWVQNWLDAGATGAGILALQSSDYVHVAENCLVIYRAVGDGKIKVACYDSSHLLAETLDSGVTASSGYMCVRRSGDVVSFFLNGAFVAEATVTDICAFTWLLVGHTSYGYAVADWIDKIRYWDSALSDEEIEYWYAKDKPRWNDSCVLWLRGDEENGDVVADASPQGNDGALTATLNDGAISGATWVVDAEKGKCLSFDGVNDYVTIPDDASINPTGEALTLSTWFYCEDVTSTMRFFSKRHYLSTEGFTLGILNGNELFFEVAFSGGWKQAREFVTANCWHLAVAVYDGSALKLYCDNVLIDSEPASGNMLGSSRVLGIGRESGTDYYYFEGKLKDCRMYNRVLSADEIAALYNRTSEVSYGCVGKWLLNEGSGLTAYDSHNRFPAKRGNGLNFDGTEYVTVPSDSSLAPTSEFTLCCWTKIEDQDERMTPFIDEAGVASYQGYMLYGDVYSTYANLRLNLGGGIDVNSSLRIPYNQQVFIASSYRNAGDEVHFRMNTQTETFYATGKVYTPRVGDVRVGYCTWAWGGEKLFGLIDEAMIFNRALSATELKRVYEADGFLDYIPLQIQDGSLIVSVDSVGVQWDSWANGACRRKHLGLGKNVAYTFTAIEEAADVPWIDSAAYILKEKKDSGTPIDLYIKKTDVLAAESTSVVIDSMNVRYSPTMQVRYIDFSVREQ